MSSLKIATNRLHYTLLCNQRFIIMLSYDEEDNCNDSVASSQNAYLHSLKVLFLSMFEDGMHLLAIIMTSCDSQMHVTSILCISCMESTHNLELSTVPVHHFPPKGKSCVGTVDNAFQALSLGRSVDESKQHSR